MRRFPTAKAALTSVLAAGLLLGGCAETRLRDQADFGDAARQDRAAQIADPDAHYAGVVAPGSNGLRADAAMERYVKGQVIPPADSRIKRRAAVAAGLPAAAPPERATAP